MPTSLPLQQQLDASQAQVDLAAGHFGLGFWQWNVSNGLLCADRHTAEAFGMDPAGVPVAEALARLVHPDDYTEVRSTFEKAAAGRETSHRARLVRPDGSIHHLELRVQPMHDADGRVSAVLAVT